MDVLYQLIDIILFTWELTKYLALGLIWLVSTPL